MRPLKYNWHDIEQEFIQNNVPLHNGVTLKTIAEKYKIPYQTVRRKAAADKWHSKRYWLWIYKETPEGIKYMAKLDGCIKELEKVVKSL